MILTDYTTYTLFDSGTSLLSGDQFDYYADICSNAIEIYLNRSLGEQSNIESHWCDESNTVLLNQYPVNDIYLVTQGLAEYGQLTMKDTKVPIQINYDGADVKIGYGFGLTKNIFAASGYDTMGDLLSAIKADIELETTGICEYTSPSNYSDISPIYLSNIRYTSASRNGIFEFYGYDLDSQISYTLEADRILQFNHILRAGSNAIMVRYNSGYGSISDLPVSIVDVCNRMIRDILNSDTQYDNNQYQKEKLGNSEFTKWDYGVYEKQSSPYNLVGKYKGVLDKYKIFDIAFR